MPLRVYDINGGVKTASSGTVVTGVTASSPLASSGGSAPNISVSNQNANLFLAGPTSGGAAAPSFRALVTADLTTQGLYALGGYAVLEDQKSSGTNGGGSTAGSDQVRTINTTVYNIGSIVSGLSSNQFTLIAGTYRIWAGVVIYKGNACDVVLRDVTGAGDLKRGYSRWSDATGAGEAVCDIIYEGTFGSSNTFEIRSRVGNTQATNGFGNAGSYGTECYLRVEILKLG